MPSSSARILLVEDEERVAETVSDLLDALGYEVSVAHSAEAALQLLRKSSPYQLLVSDVVMPGASGADLAKEARRITGDLRVLLTSGYSASIVDSARRDVPGCNYLPKPYSLKELADAVAACLGGKPPAPEKGGGGGAT
jgi:two-component system cell cycle sensor histidine kinase/response regulator CckA